MLGAMAREKIRLFHWCVMNRPLLSRAGEGVEDFLMLRERCTATYRNVPYRMKPVENNSVAPCARSSGQGVRAHPFQRSHVAGTLLTKINKFCYFH
jgi:hypothetical protein